MGRRVKAGACVLAIIGCGAMAQQASAATINVACGNTAALAAAITAANGTVAADTIEVTGAPCTFTLTAPAVTDNTNGSTGLPFVTAPLTINGHGATITRSGASGTPNFRIFVVFNTPLELNELVISGGKLAGAAHPGAGIWSFVGDLRLNNSAVTGNAGTGNGGGIYANGGQLTTNRSLISFNAAANGGGVYSNGNASGAVRATTFVLNAATGSTGAVLQIGGTILYENDTFAVNRAGNAIGGIAVLNNAAANGTANVVSSTFADNGGVSTAPGTALLTLKSGAGLATINVTDTIVTDTDSTAPAVLKPCNTDFGGTIVNGGGNIEWPHNTCGFGTQADPKLGAFANHGGVFVYSLLPTSPAIDLGGATCPATDARGATRPDGDGCDAGAFETNPPQTSAVGPTGPTNAPSITFTSDEPNSTFECRVDGVGSFTACTSPYTPTLPDGSHTVEVRAIDAEGYVDASPASVTFVVDTTAPVVEITNAPSGASGSVTFTVDDESATVTCKLDAQDPAPCSSPFAYSGLGGGSHTVVVTATDAAGNSGSDSVTWVVDLTPPETTITGGPTGTVYSTNPTTTQSWTFTSSEPASTFECRLDNAAFAPCTSPKTIGGIPPGTHTFAVRAIDGAGNVDPTPATRTFAFQRCNVIQVGVDLFGNPITICL